MAAHFGLHEHLRVKALHLTSNIWQWLRNMRMPFMNDLKNPSKETPLKMDVCPLDPGHLLVQKGNHSTDG